MLCCTQRSVSRYFYEGNVSDKPELISDLGNFISLLWESVMKTSTFLDGGDFNFWEVRFEHRACIIQKIPEQDAYLSIIGNEKLNPGFIRLEIKKAMPQLSKLL